jgi:Polyketide cyclase / dehydrase and lipid transport
MIGSIRHEIRIARPASAIWPYVGDPGRLHEWFPGIVSCQVDGTTRIITTGAGLPMPEQIITNDATQRRFQYAITAPIFRYHRGTIDVIDLGDGTSLVVYSTDAEPRTMALVIGGGTHDALAELKRQLEGGAPESDMAPAPVTEGAR